MDTIAIQVPQTLYHRLERLAALSGRPIESLVVQTLSSTIPPLPDDLPPHIRDQLIALEALSDDELWQVMHSTFPADQYEQFAELREKRRAGSITEAEQALLDQLSQAADLVSLCKAYSAVLLKWRGHKLPSLAALES
jgi:hypothetical protein